MQPGVQAAFARSGGLITREEALDLGVSPSLIQALVRDGEWVRVRRGVYADGAVWAALDEWRGRPRLLARAAISMMRRGWILSHDSAAHEHAMAILRPTPAFVHVTRPGFTNAWTKAGVKHHLATFRPEQVVEPTGLNILDMARTAADIARERGFTDGVAACDSAMRMGVTRQELMDAYEPMVSWPYVTEVRAAVEFADAGAANPAESLGRILVAELGLGEVETQFPVPTPCGVYWCDMRVGNHLFEVDGRIKYLTTAEGGVVEGSIAQVLWDERKRQQLVCAEGLGMSRITWEDYWGPRRELAKQRLLAENDVTVARFGRELAPHLARSAAEIRARRTA